MIRATEGRYGPCIPWTGLLTLGATNPSSHTYVLYAGRPPESHVPGSHLLQPYFPFSSHAQFQFQGKDLVALYEASSRPMMEAERVKFQNPAV